MDENKNGGETFPLDDAAIALIAELRQTITNAQVALNAILQYFAKQHQLALPLQLHDNGRELILPPARQVETYPPQNAAEKLEKAGRLEKAARQEKSQ